MPSACTNCLGFHYGECRQPVKQCFMCHGFGHIERYCPNKQNRIRQVRGEPLAGTRAWCDMHGLQKDPELKKRILNALKVNPGSAIYVNDVCIYLGTERHFDVDDKPSRGRTLEQRVQKDHERSMSPPRYRQPSPRVYGGRSPLRDNGPPGYYGFWQQQGRYRSRSPLAYRRRTPSPYRLPSHAHNRQPDYRGRSPRYARDSNAVVFEARDVSDRRGENRAPTRAAPVKFNMPPAQPNFHQTGGPFNTPGQTSGNIPGNNNSIVRGGPLQARGTNSQPIQGVIKESQSRSQAMPGSLSHAEAYQAFKAGQSQMSPPAASSETETPGKIDDPHFVLGVTKGASRDEVLDAYQQRMGEIEEERRADEYYHERLPSHIWQDSIAILIDAKRQLLGGA